MRTSSTLLGTTMAAMLIACPGLVFAQSGGNSDHVGTAMNSMAYGTVGNGGYTGMAMPLPNSNNSNAGNTTHATRPSQRNPLLADNGDARASKMIGTDVYNDRNQNIGSINDVLIGTNGAWVIMSANNRQVALPMREFVFGNASRNGNNKVVLPKMTQAELYDLPIFHYDASNYNNNPGSSANRSGNRGDNGNNNG